jgi:phosphoenolpyruvate synthase/pyruvate phosphate dikinase
MILPLQSETTLETSGGKGANLSRLARAGFPVPPGFIVTTQAYRDYVARNQMESWPVSSQRNGLFNRGCSRWIKRMGRSAVRATAREYTRIPAKTLA